MELKVTCDCGQKYKFDVEPVNGQIPFTVNCPVCGMDGTPLANQLLGQQQFAAPGPIRVALPATEPAAQAGSGLKINRAAAEAAPPPLAAASVAAPPVALSPLRPLAAVKSAPKEFSLGLGTLGAGIGAVLGALAVYGFFVWADFKFPWSGTGIGLLAGFGARILARGTDSTLGAIAAAITVAAVLGVFYLIYLQFGLFYISAIFSAIIGAILANRLSS